MRNSNGTVTTNNYQEKNMSHTEETTQELTNPCTFCGEGEACRHGGYSDGCWNCCLDCRREEEIADLQRKLPLDFHRPTWVL